MATLSSALSIANGALQNDQAALNAVANNVANANTSGYTREVPDWSENPPVVIGGRSYGDGAEVTDISSQRDRVLEQSLAQQTQIQAGTATRLTALQNIESVFSTAATNNANSSTPGGIDGSLNGFFGALSQLEGSPASDSLRQQVLSAAQQLAASFNGAVQQLQQQQAGLDQQSGSLVSQVNALTSAIAQLNQQISTQSPNSDAGTLEDQRQQDISQLSQLIGIHQVQLNGNNLTITTSSGAALVSGSQSYALSTGESGGVTHIYDAQGNDLTTSLAGGGGEIGGLLTARDQDIPDVETALDTLAGQLATQLNTVNEAGADTSGNPGGPIFTIPAGTAPGVVAGGISVAITDPAQIAGAGYAAPVPPATTGAPLGPSDGTNVTALANVANAAIIAQTAPTALLGVTTPTTASNFYADFTTALGSLTAQTSTVNTAQQASLTQLQNQRNGLSTVDLNEEASSLTDLERAYQAGSKLFTIIDTVLASAINLGVDQAVS